MVEEERVTGLTSEIIETKAENLLVAYGRKFSPVIAPPVPVEPILEHLLGIPLEMDDLDHVFGIPGIDGATCVNEKRVMIHERLDPTANPRMEGRFRFTVGHEIGHWCCHRSKLSSFVFCGANQNGHWSREYEADWFSAAFIMQRSLVFKEWREFVGVPPLEWVPRLQDAHLRRHTLKFPSGDEREFKDVATFFAKRFHVSQWAMWKRLETLGLLQSYRPPSIVFL